jgi:hypothetical protein
MRLTDTPPADVGIYGVHGGAGTTTVARLLNAEDLGREWPGPRDPRHLFLTARTNAHGLTAASQALAGYCSKPHPDGPYLAGFILVADAPGRLPKPLKRRITILASATNVYRLPWVPAWRLSDTAYDDAIAVSLREFAALAIHPGALREGPSCTAA